MAPIPFPRGRRFPPFDIVHVVMTDVEHLRTLRDLAITAGVSEPFARRRMFEGLIPPPDFVTASGRLKCYRAETAVIVIAELAKLSKK